MSSTPTDQSSALISSEKYYLVKSTDSMGSMDRNFNNNNVNMNNGIDTHNLWKYNKHPHPQQNHQNHHHHHQQLMQSYNNISNGIANDSSNVIGNNSQQMLSGVHQRQHQQQQQPLSATTESGVGREYIYSLWRKCIKILKMCLFYGDFWLFHLNHYLYKS